MSRKFLIAGVIFVSLILRLYVSVLFYHGDLNNNISWAKIASEKGFNGFYERLDWPYSRPNQPPLTIITFATVYKLWKGIDTLAWNLNDRFQIFPSKFIWFWESGGIVLMIKLPSILADIFIGLIIYQIFKKKKLGNPILGMSLWLFNPLVFYSSSVWGQTDSVVNLLGLLSFVFLINNKITKSFIMFTLSILFKGSLAILIPILVYVAIRKRFSPASWFRSFVVVLFVVTVVCVWFYPGINILTQVVNLYLNRIFPGETSYLTVNAFNFWWLVDHGKTLDSSLFLHLPARIWGFVIYGAVLTLIAFFINDFKNWRKIVYALALSALAGFLFLTRVHERYMYPFFPIGVLLSSGNAFLTIAYIILSLINLLNLYSEYWQPPVQFLINSYGNSYLSGILSFASIIIFIFMIRGYIKNSK